MVKKVVETFFACEIEEKEFDQNRVGVQIVIDRNDDELKAEARYPQTSHPYSVIPPCFFRRSATEAEGDNSRRVFSVETWDGRSVMSLETKS